METINKVTLKGGISGVRKTGSEGNQAARFVLMTRHCVDGWDGRQLVTTELHNVQVWKSVAWELFDKINDGKIVELEGRIRYIKYISAEGVEKVLTEIIATKLVSVEEVE